MSNISNWTKLLGILNNMPLDGCYDDIMNRQIKNRELLKEVIKNLEENYEDEFDKFHRLNCEGGL